MVSLDKEWDFSISTAGQSVPPPQEAASLAPTSLCIWIFTS